MDNLVGLCLNDALSKIDESQYNIEIEYTKGLNKKFYDELNEPRVVKLEFGEKVVKILACNF